VPYTLNLFNPIILGISSFPINYQLIQLNKLNLLRQSEIRNPKAHIQ